MANIWDFEDDEGQDQSLPKRGPGRPKGARNKTPTQKYMLEQFDHLLKSVEHMLTDEQRRYYQEAFSGRNPLDPIKEMELLIRLHGVYTMTTITESLGQRKASKEVAENVAQQRMGLKDLEEMKRKRQELEDKRGEQRNMVDPTRKSEVGILDRFLTEGSEGE